MRKSLAKVPSRFVLHAVIIALVIIWLLPTLGVLVTSFRTPQEISSSGWWMSFSKPFDFTQYTLANYKGVISQQGLGRSFLNSLIIAVPATIFPILIASFGAYAFAWMKFPMRNFLFMLMVGMLVVPLQVTFIPILTIYNKLHLAGTFPGIWLAHTAYGLPLTLYLMHNFIAGLPRDLFDSAAIDGASPLRSFFSIVIPLSVPAIAAVAIFQFLWVWNDLLVALIYLLGSPNLPLTVKIALLVGSRGQAWWLLTAAAFVSMLLPMVIFFSLQRYFVRGILAGSVKG